MKSAFLIVPLLALAVLAGCPGGDDAADDDTADDDTADDDTAEDDDTEGDDDGGDDDTADDDTVGDDDSGDDDTGEDDDDTAPVPGPDFRLTGPYSFGVTQGSHQTADGCDMGYDLYEPQQSPGSILVVLSHGAESAREQMQDWGQHFATWGLTVVAPNLCHCTLLDMDHEQNAEDLVDLANFLSPGPVVYVGHSSGGTAAFRPSDKHPDRGAMLGFDPTEWGTTVESIIAGLKFPTFGLIAEPNVCNFFDAIVPVYPLAPQGRALRVTEAGHCDFESPSAWTCTLGCGEGTNNLFSDLEIQDTIRGTSTGFLLWQVGLDTTGEQWWFPGQPYFDDLLSSGAISVL